MDPHAASDQLSAYLDGELTDTEALELERELARNPDLRAELDALQGVVELLRTHGPAQAPVDLLRSILAATEHEPMPISWWRRLLRPFGVPVQGVAVALVAALVLVIALDVGRRTLGTEPTPEAPSDATEPAAAATRPTQGDDAQGSAEPNAGPIAKNEPRSLDAGNKAVQTRKEAPRTTSTEPSKATDDATPAPTTKEVAPQVIASTGASDGSAGDVEVSTGTDVKKGSTTGPSKMRDEALSSTVFYRLVTTDAEAVTAINRIVRRQDGRVLDHRGREVYALDLVQGTPETLHIDIDRRKLDEVVRDLGRIGTLRREPSQTFTNFGAVIVLQVEVTATKSAPGSSYAPEPSEE